MIAQTVFSVSIECAGNEAETGDLWFDSSSRGLEFGSLDGIPKRLEHAR